MSPLEMTWLHKTGRDSEGELINDYVLLHSSGRILAIILAPTSEGGYAYSLGIRCDTRGGSRYEYSFIDLDSAQKFAESINFSLDIPGITKKSKKRTKKCLPVPRTSDPEE